MIVRNLGFGSLRFSSNLSKVVASARGTMFGQTYAFSSVQYTPAKPALFDNEMSLIYKKIAEQHRHPAGPWKLILEKVQALDLQAGSTILDLASGPGEPAATIASMLPDVTVISTDISPDMNRIAAKKAIGIHNLKAMIADLQDLSDFEDSSVDTVTCCYGYMFPEDKLKALKETHRVLKPGGTLVATYWHSLDVFGLTREIMAAVLNGEPPLPPLNPMSLCEPGLFESLAKNAGFCGKIDFVQSQYPFDIGCDKDFQYKFVTMILKAELDKLNAHEVAKEAFGESISKYAVTESETGCTVLPNNIFVLATCTK